MSHSLLSHSFFTSATLFLSRLSNPTLYSGWSVGPPSLAFLAHMSGSCSTSAAQIHGQPITAPAHPHATLVAVYPGLFFFVLLSLHRCRILLALLHLLLAPFLPTISSSPHSETFREAPASFRVTALLVTPKNARLEASCTFLYSQPLWALQPVLAKITHHDYSNKIKDKMAKFTKR